MGQLTNVWFERRQISPFVEEDLDSIQQSADDIGELVDMEIKNGIKPERIIIGKLYNFISIEAIQRNTGNTKSIWILVVQRLSPLRVSYSVVEARLSTRHRGNQLNVGEILSVLNPTWPLALFNVLRNLAFGRSADES